MATIPRKEYKEFDSFEISYGITNPLGRDLIRITFSYNGVVVGQALFGAAIQPGSYAAYQEKKIYLYFPTAHFASIWALLDSGKKLAVFVEYLGPSDDEVSGGGILVNPN